MPWLLSVAITGAIAMVYLCCITAPQHRMGDCLLVLTCSASHSGLMAALTPGQCETELVLLC